MFSLFFFLTNEWEDVDSQEGMDLTGCGIRPGLGAGEGGRKHLVQSGQSSKGRHPSQAGPDLHISAL
jgi:hypothetical protein